MLTRRRFLATGVSAAATLPSIRVGMAQEPLGTRRSIHSMGPNDPDFVAYRRGVAAMKALPGTDPRNWFRFADIHNNYCPHQNWYFLPWHRAYLTSLERVIRELTGKQDFALPYWDWTKDRQFPAAFMAGNPNNNPLNHQRPGFSPNHSLPDDMVGPAVMTRIMNSPDFEAFGSGRPTGQNNVGAQWQRRIGTSTELEFNPHDGVHSTIGGDMGTVERSPRDPIFYLHHGNVDRLWSEWIRRGNTNSTEPYWRDFSFRGNFVTPAATRWDASVEEMQATPTLGYRYDGDRGPFAADLDFAAAAAAADNPLASQLQAYRRLSQDIMADATREFRKIPLPLGGTLQVAAVENNLVASRENPIGIPVTLGRPLSEVVRAAAQPAEIADGAPKRGRQCVWAVIRDIDPPSDGSTRVRVFVNREGLAPNAAINDPHYVTSLSFFGARHANHAGMSGHDHHAQAGHSTMMVRRGGTVSIDLTPALTRLRGTRQFQNDKIVVQLVPVCPNGTPGSVMRPRRMEIAII